MNKKNKKKINNMADELWEDFRKYVVAGLKELLKETPPPTAKEVMAAQPKFGTINYFKS